MKRGEIYWVDLSPSKGSEQSETRPVLVIQNDIGNYYSSVTLGMIFTSEYQEKDKNNPTNVFVLKDIINRLDKDSLLETSQIRALDVNTRFGDKIGEIDKTTMKKVEKALKISLEIIDKCPSCNYMLMEPKKNCPKCKLQLLNQCLDCGELLDMSWKNCPQCGKEVVK